MQRRARAAPRRARAPRPACAWRARCAARWSARRPGRRARSPSVLRPPSSLSVSASRASVLQHRVAGGEDQAQQVVADLVLARRVERVDEVGHHQRLLRLQVERRSPRASRPGACRGAAGPARGASRWSSARHPGCRARRRAASAPARRSARPAPAPRPGRCRAPCARRRRRCAPTRCARRHRSRGAWPPGSCSAGPLSSCRCPRPARGSAAPPGWARSPPARTGAAPRSRSRCRPETAAGSGATTPAPRPASAPG